MNRFLHMKRFLSFYAVLVSVIVAVNLNFATAAPIGVGPTNSATITHDPGFSGPGIPAVTGPFATPAAFPVFQYPETTFSGGPGGASSTGHGGISNLILPFIAGVIFPNDTGVSQTSPGGAVVNPATLRIDFNVDFGFNGGGFGPPVFEVGFFPLIGNVGGDAGDFVSFEANATFVSAATGVYGPGVSLSYTNNNPGPFSTELLFVSEPLPQIPANDTLTLQGFILFTASNQTAPSSIFLGSLGDGDGNGGGPFPIPPGDGFPPDGDDDDIIIPPFIVLTNT